MGFLYSLLYLNFLEVDKICNSVIEYVDITGIFIGKGGPL